MSAIRLPTPFVMCSKSAIRLPTPFVDERPASRGVHSAHRGHRGDLFATLCGPRTHAHSQAAQMGPYHFDEFSWFAVTGAHKGNQRDRAVEILEVRCGPIECCSFFTSFSFLRLYLLSEDIAFLNTFSEMLQAKMCRQRACSDVNR